MTIETDWTKTGIGGGGTTSGALGTPTGVTATPLSSSEISVDFQPPVDTSGIDGYYVLRDGVVIGTTTGTNFVDSGLSPGSTHSYEVVPYAVPQPISATTDADAPPTVPTGLTVTPASSSQNNLAWTASTDPIAVTGYHLTRNGVALPDTTNTTYADTGLQPNTLYSYTVEAFDATGDVSGPCAAVSATTDALSSGFLPAGHWIAAKKPMNLVYPEADSTVEAFARHRWAYYDGVNPVNYRIPLGIQFGAYPYVFELVTAPAGMTLGTVWNSGTTYGVLNWTPNAAVSGATVQVLVTDQQNNTLTLTFTVSTSSSTVHFIFVDAVNGNDANAGTIGAPLKTLAAAYGSTFAAVVNAGAICYLRAGTYTLPIMTDNDIQSTTPMMEFSTVAKPSAMIGFPGDALPVIDMSTGGWGANINVNDLFFQDLAPNGYLTTQSNYRLMLATGAGMARMTADNVGWTNAGYGASAANNATGWFIDINNTNQAANIFLNGCYETNRQSGQPGNNYAGCSVYNAINMLVQGCYTIQSGLLCDAAWYFKSDVTNGEFRGCTVNVGATGGFTHAFDCGQAPDVQMTDCQTSYCTTVGGGGIFLPFSSGYTFGAMWGFRNSVNSSRGMQCLDPNSGGPYVFDSNAVQSTTALPTGTSVQTDGLNLLEASGLLDANGLLTSAYAVDVGIVGAQIG